MLDGAARLTDLFAETARMGMPALAMTDHGNVFGAYDFVTQARAAGIKPIIGMEAYVTPGTSRFDRTRVRWASGGEDDVSGGGAYTHMTLLAIDEQGLHNLFRLASLASLEGYFYKPRVDRELLARHSAGLIGTTGCPGGEVQTRLRIGQYDAARAAAAELRDIFGPDRFYLELMDHGLDVEARVRDDLMRLRDDLGLPHARDQRPALHVRRRRRRARGAAVRAVGQDHGRPQAVQARRPRLLPEVPGGDAPGLAGAAGGVRQHAAGRRAGVRLRRGVQLPRPDAALRRCPRARPRTAGWSPRSSAGWPGGSPAACRRRTASRRSTSSASSPRWASRATSSSSPTCAGTPASRASGSGRAAGRPPAPWWRTRWASPSSTRSQHGLLFERFLNPERISMPDIDMDFDERRRGDMIRYATEKYGEERVAQIITYGTIKAKQAVKDSARVLGYPFSTGDRITKAMPPPVMGKDVPLRGIFDESHPRWREAAEFRALYEADAEVKRVVDTARGLEGLKRQWGVHAAGVILSREPLLDVIPIQRREQDGAIITQFDMGACESLGLLKMDFLGLRNLTVLDDCLLNIRSNRGLDVVLEDLAAGRPGGVRAARPRRHPRRLPARRRADAGAAALDAAHLLRRHLRGRRALPAGSDGRQRAQRVRRPQERPQAGDADPPRAGRAAGRDPGRDVRADRLPGAGPARSRRRWPATRSARPTCCARRWARRRRRSSTRSSSRSPAA